MFSFDVNFAGYHPDGLRYAFFTAADGLIHYGSKGVGSFGAVWSDTLTSDEVALASYTQVVVYKSGVGTSNRLTMYWPEM